MRLFAVVLAAGAGARFGGGKLMALLHGRPLIEHALETAAAAPVETTILVTGADLSVGPQALAWAAEREAALTTVFAERHAEGLSASLKAGLAALPPGAEGAFIFLGDMPRIPAALLQPLARALRAGAPAAVPTCRGELGHPALLGPAVMAQAAGLTGDRGARALLLALGPALARVETDDPGVLYDVDTPVDLGRP